MVEFEVVMRYQGHLMCEEIQILSQATAIKISRYILWRSPVSNAEVFALSFCQDFYIPTHRELVKVMATSGSYASSLRKLLCWEISIHQLSSNIRACTFFPEKFSFTCPFSSSRIPLQIAHCHVVRSVNDLSLFFFFSFRKGKDSLVTTHRLSHKTRTHCKI
jgi:hypothetical protein